VPAAPGAEVFGRLFSKRRVLTFPLRCLGFRPNGPARRNVRASAGSTQDWLRNDVKRSGSTFLEVAGSFDRFVTALAPFLMGGLSWTG
jgi:hypothetical protein